MVKSAVLSSPLLHSNSKSLCRQLKSMLSGSADQLNKTKFVSILIELNTLKPRGKPFQDSFSILFICLILQEHNKSKEESVFLTSSLQEILLSLVHHYFTDKNWKKNSKSLQHVLNKSSNIILENPTNPSVLKCAQLLTLIQKLSSDIMLKAILKMLVSSNDSSAFSLIINNSVPVLPPREEAKWTLVLDLDETLGHFNGKIFQKRPFVHEFLHSMSSKFELVLFTSSVECYANYAMSIIDPENKVNFRLYRQHLTVANGSLVKDLSILGRDLKTVLFVDNDPKYLSLHPENGILIPTWVDSLDDEELLKIRSLLSCYNFTPQTTASDLVSLFKV
jgi:carboxy-terminal domain RNA polymerase II polypeptide A small phosphatase